MELDRLVELYRNKGYMRFTRNELVAVWDTVNVSLLKPTVNPMEQIELINTLTKQQEKSNGHAGDQVETRIRQREAGKILCRQGLYLP
jgi:hypothetical protein